MEASLITDYELSHLAHHLINANQAAALHGLLGAEATNGRSIWYELKTQRGRLDEYIAEVRLADNDAERTAFEQVKLKLPLSLLLCELRYALILSSMTSILGNLSPDVIRGLVISELWSFEKALQLSRRIPDPSKKGIAIALLSETAEGNLRLSLFAEAVDELGKLPTLELLEAIPRIIIYTPSAFRERVAQLVLTAWRGQDYLKAWHLDKLVACSSILGEDIRAIVLSEVNSIWFNGRDRLHWGRERSTCVAAVIALSAGPATTKEWLRLRSAYPDYTPLLMVVDRMKSAECRRRLLAHVQAVCSIDKRPFDGGAYVLWARLSKQEVGSARYAMEKALIESAGPWLKYTNNDPRQIISALVPGLSPSLFDNVFNLIMSLSENYKIENIGVFAKYAPDPLREQSLREALEIAQKVDDKRGQARLSLEFASHLTDSEQLNALKHSAELRLSDSPDDDYDAAFTIIKLAPHAPTHQMLHLLEYVSGIRESGEYGHYNRAIALKALLPRLPENLLGRATDLAKGMKDDYGASVLVSLAVVAPKEFRDQVLNLALTRAKEISHPLERAFALTQLLPLVLPQEREGCVKAVLRIIKERDDPVKVSVLVGVLRYLDTRDRAKEIESMLQRLLDELSPHSYLAEQLTELAPYLSDKEIRKIWVLLVQQPVSAGIVRAMAELATYLSSTERGAAMKEVTALALALPDNSEKAKALLRIATQAETAEPIALFREIFSAISSLDDDDERARLYSEASSVASKQERIIAYSMWRDALLLGATLERDKFLVDLQAMTPLIESLGGKTFSHDVVMAVKHVTQWFRFEQGRPI